MLKVNNYKGYLLSKLAEECSEVSHAISKLLCFGRCNTREGSYVSNNRKVEMEIVDILGSIELLMHNKVLSSLHIVDEEAIHKKMVKIKRCWGSSLRTSAGWDGSPDDIRLPGDMEKDDRQMEFDF